jgi:hypothetical protein
LQLYARFITRARDFLTGNQKADTDHRALHPRHEPAGFNPPQSAFAVPLTY